MRRITWSECGDREKVLARLREEFTDTELVERSADERVQGELDEFFAGKRERFEVAVDPRPQSAFQERVLRRVLHTRFGETVTYGELARAVDKPGAARAVGRVMATNPLPIIIPCHRVLPADRSLGNYTGGVRVKEFLLGLEGVHLETPLLDPSWT
ncbi:MAG: methylated-DNA--[protein]-cysteine S-methyltransferase [Candidatus Binatia bacterium]|nr:methylated-DNA--[protein]-cysteine S-methyltransferase [Candidatus Binatia bacterium]